MKLSIKELVEASEGRLIQGEASLEEFNVSTDSRTIKNIDFFLPLSGENFDGHKFIEMAVDKGCRGYFTQKDGFKPAEFVLLVDDALKAYLRIARYIRRKINPKVIAITGSSGKTSVKEFVYEVLATSFKTHKSFLNHNNEVGLCQTLLSMPEDTQYAVIEMGMRGLDEIELLSKYSEPDIAVVSNVGTAHIGRLGSIENIAKAKCEITTYLKESGTFIAFDDELIKRTSNWHGETVFYGKEYEITRREEDFTEFVYKDEHYKIPVIGEYNVVNAIAAVEIGMACGVSGENITKGLLNYKPVGDRGRVIALNNGAKLIVDCYNANPDSVKASIGSLINTYKGSEITLVLGDMAELGEHEEELHRGVGEFISDIPVKSLITIGERAKFIAKGVKNSSIEINSFLNIQEAESFLNEKLGENSIIMFKASRCMKLEALAKSLSNKLA